LNWLKCSKLYGTDSTISTALEEDDEFNMEAHLHNSHLEAEERFGLHHFSYNNSAILGNIFRNMEHTDFVGLTVSQVLYVCNQASYSSLDMQWN
jgi:hypothetical protein